MAKEKTISSRSSRVRRSEPLPLEKANGDIYDKTISVIIRTIDNRFDSLERAVFSIYCNDYQYKEVVIVYQGFSDEYAKELASLRQIYPDMPMQVVHNPTTKDERGKNANLGVLAARGRYVGFLDDDDVLLPNHLDKLYTALSESGKTWAYGQVCVDYEDDGVVTKKEYPFLHKEFSFLRLWENIRALPCMIRSRYLAKIERECV